MQPEFPLSRSPSAEAEQVLSRTASLLDSQLGERLVATFAIGSLAHGGFAPLVSDIDVCAILADPIRPGDVDALATVTKTVQATGGIAERLSLFWTTPQWASQGSDGGRLPPVDRLDLADHGRPLESSRNSRRVAGKLF